MKNLQIYGTIFGLLLIVFMSTIVCTNSVDAGYISPVNVYSIVDGNTFGVYAKWTEYGNISIIGKLHYDGILIEETEIVFKIDDVCYLEIYEDTIKDGTYLFQLWSNGDNTELLFEKSWEVPRFVITQSITTPDSYFGNDGDPYPIEGQIGTMFVATTALSLESDGPDVYHIDGVLTTTFNDIHIEQSIDTYIKREDYYEFYKYDDYSNKPILVSNILTFTEGNYEISSTYSDVNVQQSSDIVNVDVINQFQPGINNVDDKIENLEGAVDKDIQSVKNGANSDNLIVMIIAIVAVIIGLTGVIIGFIGISKSKKIKKYAINTHNQELQLPSSRKHERPLKQIDQKPYPPPPYQSYSQDSSSSTGKKNFPRPSLTKRINKESSNK